LSHAELLTPHPEIGQCVLQRASGAEYVFEILHDSVV
jgi:hypothetical protein